jgi:hypothetical protein
MLGALGKEAWRLLMMAAEVEEVERVKVLLFERLVNHRTIHR